MQFVLDVMDIAAPIDHLPELAAWSIHQQAFRGKAAATSEWGTARRDAGLLLEDALNNRVPQVYDNNRDERGLLIATINPVETEAAKDKLNKIKAAFGNWVWRDPERTTRLCRVYNDLFNNLAPRRFSGAHLMLPGASTAIQMRSHQKRVVWRGITAGSTYIAHQVGAGKTMAIAALVMEQRRLGLVTKPLIVVPGHCLADFSRAFIQLYPNCPHPGRRRDQLREGQAVALPGPGGNGRVGRHHHHPFGLQIHRRANRVRAGPVGRTGRTIQGAEAEGGPG